MDVTTQMHYPGASVDQVMGLLFDPKFRAAVCEATLALQHDVAITPNGNGSTAITIARTMPAEVPDFVKRFVGDTIQLTQTETWPADDGSGARIGSLSLRVVGQPVTMKGTIAVRAVDGGATETISADLDVSIPFIGGKIESEIARGLAAAAAAEERTGRAWLAR